MHVDCKGLSNEELVKAKEELKEGAMQKRVQLFKTLPYSKELITNGLD